MRPNEGHNGGTSARDVPGREELKRQRRLVFSKCLLHPPITRKTLVNGSLIMKQ